MALIKRIKQFMKDKAAADKRDLPMRKRDIARFVAEQEKLRSIVEKWERGEGKLIDADGKVLPRVIPGLDKPIFEHLLATGVTEKYANEYGFVIPDKGKIAPGGVYAFPPGGFDAKRTGYAMPGGMNPTHDRVDGTATMAPGHMLGIFGIERKRYSSAFLQVNNQAEIYMLESLTAALVKAVTKMVSGPATQVGSLRWWLTTKDKTTFTHPDGKTEEIPVGTSREDIAPHCREMYDDIVAYINNKDANQGALDMVIVDSIMNNLAVHLDFSIGWFHVHAWCPFLETTSVAKQNKKASTPVKNYMLYDVINTLKEIQAAPKSGGFEEVINRFDELALQSIMAESAS